MGQIFTVRPGIASTCDHNNDWKPRRCWASGAQCDRMCEGSQVVSAIYAGSLAHASRSLNS